MKACNFSVFSHPVHKVPTEVEIMQVGLLGPDRAAPICAGTADIGLAALHLLGALDGWYSIMDDRSATSAAPAPAPASAIAAIPITFSPCTVYV